MAVYTEKDYCPIGRPTDPALDPTITPTELDCAWTGGYLEGRGTFTNSQGTARVVVQDRESARATLKRTRDRFGGKIYPGPSYGDVKKIRYIVTGSRVAELFYKIKKHLSPMRRKQLAATLDGMNYNDEVMENE